MSLSDGEGVGEAKVVAVPKSWAKVSVTLFIDCVVIPIWEANAVEMVKIFNKDIGDVSYYGQRLQ